MATKNVYTSEGQRNGRLITGAKIASLATAFSLADNKPFSIYINPTSGTGTTEVLTVKLLGQTVATAMPFKVEAWSELLITEISADDILSTYDVYWASGEVAEVSA
jgi:hypothetical protein